MTNNLSIHINPLQEYMLRLTRELSLARHGASSRMELMAFYLLITLIEDREEQKNSVTYSLNALEMANMLGINQSKGRGTIVANLFRRLRKEEILLPRFDRADGKEIGFDAYGYLNEIHYDASTKKIDLSLAPKVNEILFRYKTSGNFIEWQAIRALSTKGRNTLQLFVLLYGLNAMGINTIKLHEIREYLGLVNKYQENTKLMEKVIRPAEKNIRELSGYDEFVVTSNGSRERHVKVDRIFFSFNQKKVSSTLYDFSALKPRWQKAIQEQNAHKQDIIGLALAHGVREEYIPIFINFEGPDDLLHSEVRSAIDFCQRKGVDAEEEKGAVIVSAIKKGWVRNSAAYRKQIEQSLGRKENRERRKSSMELMNYESDRAMTDAYISRADHWLRSLSDKRLFEVASEHMEDIKKLMGKRVFKFNVLFTRDRRRMEYKSLRRVVIGKLISGALTDEIPMQLTL